MSTELVTMLCAGAAAVVGFVVAWHEKKQEKKSRVALILTSVLGVTAFVAGLEEYSRRSSMETLQAELERQWVVLLETQVQAVEFELLSADGLLTEGLLGLAKATRLQVPRNAFGEADPESGVIEFEQIFSPDELSRRGRVGINVSQVRTSTEGGKKTIEKFDRADCMASRSITVAELTPAAGDILRHACSMMVSFAPSNARLKLADIVSWPLVSLTQKVTKDAKCLGVCKYPMLISVRLALSGKNLVQELIEISPAVLMKGPNRVSEREQSVTFELSGKALADLAHSYFLESYGYVQRDSFVLTKGMIHALYRKVTTKQTMGDLIDIVWTTDPSPDEATLVSAVPKEFQHKVVPIQLKDWCGFGDRDVCWHRFSMFVFN